MNLDATIQAFAQIPSGEGGDAVAQFQLLQSVEQALAKAHPKVINRVVSSMETAFVPVIIGGTTPPVRRAVLGCFRIAFGKASGSALSHVIGNLENYLKPKGKGDVRSLGGTVSSLEVMGGLCLSFGKQLLDYFPDNTKTFGHHMRSADPGARVAAANALGKLLEGSCMLKARVEWGELAKIIVKAASDAALDVRVAAARCMVALAQHEAFMLAAPSDAEMLLKTALQNLEIECGGMTTRPSVMGRTALATCLGTMLAAVAEFDTALQRRKSVPDDREDRYTAETEEPKSARKSKKKEKTKEASERVVVGGLPGAVRYLIRPFAVLGASRLLRTALIHSFIALFQCLGNSTRETWEQSTLIGVVPEMMMGMLAGGTKLFTSVAEIIHARECVRYILHEGLSPLCGDRALRELLEVLISMARQPNANGTVIQVALLELCSLVEVLGDSIDDILPDAVDVVMKTIGRAGSPVRSSASLALRAIVRQYPANMPSFITGALQTIKVAQAEMSMDSEVQRQMDLMHGNSLALAALLAELPSCDAGIPTEFMDSLLDFGANLLTNRTATQPYVLNSQTVSGWTIIGGIASGFDPVWLEGHVEPLMALWEAALGKRQIDSISSIQDRQQLQSVIEQKTQALDSLTAFLIRAAGLSLAREVACAAQSYLDNILVRLPRFPAGPTTNQLRLKVLESYCAFLTIVSRLSDDSIIIPKPQILKLAMDEVILKTGTSTLRVALNRDDGMLWGPQREDWFVPDDLDEFRLYADDNFNVSSTSLKEAVQVAGVPFSLRICDTAVRVAGLIISMAPEHGQPYVEHMLEEIRRLKNRPAKKKELHAALKVAFDMSKNAAGILLTAFEATALDGRVIAHEGLLTKSMDLLSTLLLEDNAVIRCAAAEAFGRLAQVAVEQFRMTCIKFLVNCMRNPKREPSVRGSFAFAIGCVCRYTDSMWHQSLMDIMGTLQSGNQFPMPAVRVWTLYASSLALEFGGPGAAEYLPSLFRQAQLIAHAAEDLAAEAKVSYVVPTYIALARLLCSTGDAIAAAEHAGILGQITDHMGNDEIMVIVHELVGQITEVREHPGVQVEFVRMLGSVLHAPGKMMQRVRNELNHCLPVPPVEYLRNRLDSLRVDVRQAAVLSLSKAFNQAEADGAVFLAHDGDDAEDMVAGLFRFLDSEHGMGDAGGDGAASVETATQLIHDILRTQAPFQSFKMLGLLRRVALGQKKDVGAEQNADADREADEETVQLPKQENGELSQLGAPRDPCPARRERKVIERWRTRLVAVSSVAIVLRALEGTAEHFDMKLAQENGGDFMSLHLSDLIGLATSIAGSPVGWLKTSALQLLQDILNRFGNAEDPYMQGSRLLEQFNAQIGAALRGSLPSDDATPQQNSVSPVALLAAIDLLRDYLGMEIVPASDAVALRRLCGLLVGPLRSNDVLGALTGSRNFDDVTECKLLVSVYAAVARVHIVFGSDPTHPISNVIAPLLPLVGQAWMDILSNFASVIIFDQPVAAEGTYTKAVTRQQLIPIAEDYFAGILIAACSYVASGGTGAKDEPGFVLSIAVAYLRGRVCCCEAVQVAAVVNGVGELMASSVVRETGMLPAADVTELVAVVHTVTTASSSYLDPQLSVPMFLENVLKSVSAAAWTEQGGIKLLQAVLEALSAVAIQTPATDGSDSAVKCCVTGAFTVFGSLSAQLPGRLLVEIIPVVFATFLCTIKNGNGQKWSEGVSTAMTTVLRSLSQAVSGDTGARDVVNALVLDAAVSIATASQEAATAEEGEFAEFRLATGLRLVEQLILHIDLDMQSPAVHGVWHMVASSVLAQGLCSGIGGRLRPCMSTLLKLSQGLATRGGGGGLPPLLQRLVHCCGESF